MDSEISPMKDRVAVWDDLGIRFEYPMDWELDVDENGPQQVISLQSAEDPAFVMVTLDEECPPPAALADEALAAMQAEYPNLENRPVLEVIDGHHAVGHDLDFFSLDLASCCVIRSFRSPRRTVLLFAQWSEIDNHDAEAQIETLRRTLEETDS